jgi:thymidylate kinase
MICVFEGPDGAGKSTMIEAVAGWHISAGNSPETIARWRAGPFPEGSDPWHEYFTPLTTLGPSLDWLVLIDRWHIGELVYGPMFRGVSRLSLAQRDYIDAYLKQSGATMVYLKARVEELERRLTERGDDMVKVEHLAPLLDAYDMIMAESHQREPFVRTYDTTGNSASPTALAIYSAAELDTRVAVSASRHPSIDHRPYWELNTWPA